MDYRNLDGVYQRRDQDATERQETKGFRAGRGESPLAAERQAGCAERKEGVKVFQIKV